MKMSNAIAVDNIHIVNGYLDCKEILYMFLEVLEESY